MALVETTLPVSASRLSAAHLDPLLTTNQLQEPAKVLAFAFTKNEAAEMRDISFIIV